MAVICREHKLLFIMTPRTACTAVADLLLTHYGGEYLPAHDVLDARGRISLQKKHSTLSDLLANGLLTMKDAGSLLKFAAVRNPFDSLVSLYIKQRSKYQPLLNDPDSWVNRSPAYARNMRYAATHSFNQWLYRKCRKQLLKRLLGRPTSMFDDYTRGVDVVIRYENLAAELNALFVNAGIPAYAPIPVVNQTSERERKDYRLYYSRMSALAVRVAFPLDLKRFGYAF
jgi:hypothetical protein